MNYAVVVLVLVAFGSLFGLVAWILRERRRMEGVREEREPHRLSMPNVLKVKPPRNILLIFMVFIVLASLNFATLSFAEISSIIYRLEYGGLDFVFRNHTMPAWLLAFLGYFFLRVGNVVSPVVYVPGLKKRRSYGYVPFLVKEDDDLVIWRLWNGYRMVAERRRVKRRGLRYLVMGDVVYTRDKDDKTIMLDDSESSIEHSMVIYRRYDILANENATLRKMVSSKEPMLTVEQMQAILKATNKGGS